MQPLASASQIRGMKSRQQRERAEGRRSGVRLRWMGSHHAYVIVSLHPRPCTATPTPSPQPPSASSNPQHCARSDEPTMVNVQSNGPSGARLRKSRSRRLVRQFPTSIIRTKFSSLPICRQSAPLPPTPSTLHALTRPLWSMFSRTARQALLPRSLQSRSCRVAP